MLLEIIPSKGVGPVKFGMTSDEVQIAMRDVCGKDVNHSQSKAQITFMVVPWK